MIVTGGGVARFAFMPRRFSAGFPFLIWVRFEASWSSAKLSSGGCAWLRHGCSNVDALALGGRLNFAPDCLFAERLAGAREAVVALPDSLRPPPVATPSV